MIFNYLGASIKLFLKTFSKNFFNFFILDFCHTFAEQSERNASSLTTLNINPLNKRGITNLVKSLGNYCFIFFLICYKMNFNEIDWTNLDIQSLVPKSPTNTRGESIYKPDIYTGLIGKQKSHKRAQLRKNRDNFLADYLQNCAKGTKERETKNLAIRWFAYAQETYLNPLVICDNNTNDNDKRLCNEFSKVMEKLQSYAENELKRLMKPAK